MDTTLLGWYYNLGGVIVASKVQWADRCLVRNPYYFGVCLTEKAFLKEMKKMGVPKRDIPDWVSKGKDGTVHTFERKNKLCAIVCFTNLEDRTPEEIIGLIVHESVHIWQDAKWALGEKDPSSEFMAYGIQNITQSMLEAYNKAKAEFDRSKGTVH